MRQLFALLVLAVIPFAAIQAIPPAADVAAYAQSPDPNAPLFLSVPAVSGEAMDFITVTAQTNGTNVRWFAKTPGLKVFPSELLKTSLSTVVVAPKDGVYTLVAYTARGDMPSEPAFCTVTVGTAPDVVVPPGPNPPDPPGPTPVTTAVTAAYYVFEKDDGPVPPFMQTAIDRLNREKKIDARPVEEDVEDGTGSTPAALKPVVDAARQKGLPGLVLVGAAGVIDVKKDLKTEAEILSLVP